MKNTVYKWSSLIIVALILTGVFSYYNPAKEPLGKMSGDQQPSMESAGDTITTTGCAANRVTVKTPAPRAFVEQSFSLQITVDNRDGDRACTWTVFEAQAGLAQVYDMNGNLLGSAPLVTSGDWMNNGPTDFSATLNIQKSRSPEMKIIITEEDVSGMGEVSTVTIPVRSLAK